jgi:hypothetical protein
MKKILISLLLLSSPAMAQYTPPGCALMLLMNKKVLEKKPEYAKFKNIDDSLFSSPSMTSSESSFDPNDICYNIMRTLLQAGCSGSSNRSCVQNLEKQLGSPKVDAQVAGEIYFKYASKAQDDRTKSDAKCESDKLKVEAQCLLDQVNESFFHRIFGSNHSAPNANGSNPMITNQANKDSNSGTPSTSDDAPDPKTTKVETAK